VKISLDKKLLNKMPRSREVQKQQIGEPALQQLKPSETLEDSEYIIIEPGRSKRYIKIPEFLPSDSEIWFNILDRNLKQNGMTSDYEKFTFITMKFKVMWQVQRLATFLINELIVFSKIIAAKLPRKVVCVL